MMNKNMPWLSKMNQEWSLVKGKYLFRNEKKIVKEMHSEYPRLALTLNGVVERSKIDSEGLQPNDYSSYQIFNKGDLVFKLIDLENKQTSRVGIAHKDGIMSPAYIRLRKNNKDINEHFAYFYYLSLYFQDVYRDLGKGVRSSLSAPDLLEIPVPVPKMEVQNKIVKFLNNKISQILNLKQSLDKQIVNLKEYKSALITQAVTKGLDPNVPMKDSGIEWLGEVPGHWKVAKLKYFAEHCARGITPFYVEDEENSIPVINQACIQSYGIKWEAVKYHDKSRTYNKGLIKAGDVLICSTGKGALGRVQVFPSIHGEYVADGHVTIVRTNQADLSNSYLRFLLSTPIYFEMMDNVWSSGSTKQTELNRSEILNMPIIVPPIDEQREITNFLEKKEMEITKVLSALEKQLNFLDIYRSSLITAAVTGQIDVSDWKEAEEELETIS